MPDSVTPRIYTRYNPAPIILCVASNKPEPIFGWEYNPEKRIPEPVQIGTRDPQAEITAARMETLTEMMARVPGKNPMEKLSNAMNAGIIPTGPEQTGAIVDMTGVKPDLVENLDTVIKGTLAYAASGAQGADGKTPLEKVLNYYEAKIAELEAKMASKPEEKKDE